MEVHVCNVCGYTYNPEVGDPKSGIKAGTHWDCVDADWRCPICSLGKEQFEKTL